MRAASPVRKPLLFRKVNTTAHGVHHLDGGDFRDQRQDREPGQLDLARLPMHGRLRRGLDYTPLFRFLLSKVGEDWNAVHAEAVSRLDRSEPIFWLVARGPSEERDCVRIGESSYFSGLKIDSEGRLQRVNPALGPESLAPDCKCCTHTFNGIRFTRPFDPSVQSG
ncbi:hypothetical protein DBR42_13080 [Pelomonas sp. HMWF004]|nr:hypothetical protein DBR42_13080 [Pelomonas sp. HMWF004]